jgi:hypothetical protein
MTRRLLPLRGVLLAVVATLVSVQVRAAVDWASPATLGDVLVGSGPSARVFPHGGGASTETIALPAGTTITATAFDVGLNLLVATDAGTIIRVSRTSRATTTVITGLPGVPRSMVLDAAGTLYVGIAGSPATVVTYDFDPATGAYSPSAVFGVACDATVTLALDLAPRRPGAQFEPVDRQRLFYVCGGRQVRYVDVLPASAMPASTVFATLPNPGSARDLALLPPKAAVDREQGGLLVADTRNVKWLDEAGGLVRTFDVPDGPQSANTWSSLAPAPVAGSFWAAQSGVAAAYRFVLTTDGSVAQPAAVASFTSTSPTAALAVNGGYRAAVSTRILTRGPLTVAPPAVFLPATSWDGSLWQNTWDVCADTAAGCGALAGDVRIAVTFHEARSGRMEPGVAVPAAFDLDQRLAAFPSARPLYAYRNRAAFIRAVRLRGADIAGVPTLITMDYIGRPAAGNAVTILLDDPDPVPHVGFSLTNGTLSTFTANIRREFFQTNETTRGGTRGLNDFLIATATAQYSTKIIAPTGVKTYQVSNPLPIRVRVNAPIDVCANLVLTVARKVPPPGAVVVGSSLTTLTDSRGIPLVFRSDTAPGNCQTNLLLLPNVSESYPAETDFKPGETYHFCVNFREGLPSLPLPSGDACGTFRTAAK